jgi:hypothetical protein
MESVNLANGTFLRSGARELTSSPQRSSGGVPGFHDLAAVVMATGLADVVGPFQLAAVRAFLVYRGFERVM